MNRIWLFTVPLLLIVLLGCEESVVRVKLADHHQEMEVMLPDDVVMEMVWIPPGTFMMGSPEDELGREVAEGPQHEVTITQGFYIGKYEVTQSQWEAVTGTRPWEGAAFTMNDPDAPVVRISWDDVQAFIGVLNEFEGEDVYRLPTEAEWEYACRAGTTTRWAFEDNQDLVGQYAWYQGSAGADHRYAHPVGERLSNTWGLYDMHGNVAEWVYNWQTDYSSGPQIDPVGPDTGEWRVVRGGGFSSTFERVRSAVRKFQRPNKIFGDVGVRLVREAP